MPRRYTDAATLATSVVMTYILFAASQYFQMGGYFHEVSHVYSR